ncbi:MAG: GNAT family N-acetyltransferase [Brumimicrobium sp.]
MAFHPPILKSERFLIRPIKNSDLKYIFQGLSHPDVIRYYGVSFQSLEATKEQMEFYKNLLKTETGLFWAICSKENETFHGVGGFNNLSKEHKKAEVGFWLLPEYWGKGVMNETMPILCNYVFDQLHLHRIEGFIESGNLSCIKAIKKLGFSHEGTMKDCEVKNGKFISLEIYAKLNSSKTS